MKPLDVTGYADRTAGSDSAYRRGPRRAAEPTPRDICRFQQTSAYGDMSTTLFATVLLGTAFVGALVGLSRLDVDAPAYATDGSGAGSTNGNAATVEQIESRLLERSVFRAVAGVTAVLTLVLVVVVADGLLGFAGFAGGLADTVVVLLFVLVGALLFVSTYAWSKRLDLGTAHALAAALFVAGFLFVLLIAADLLLGILP